MAKEIKNKNLTNTRLANNYGGWIYCDACGENIGNLCYQTYDKINFKYTDLSKEHFCFEGYDDCIGKINI